MSHATAKQIVLRFYDAFNQHNIEELEQVIQPDSMIHPEIPGAGSTQSYFKANNP